MTKSQTVAELEQQLVDCERAASPDVHKQIDILNDLAWALSDTDLRRAYDLARRAYELAASPPDKTSPYQAGQGHGLRTMGYVNQRLGDYPTGLNELLQALRLLEGLPADGSLVDVYDGIAGIHFQIGNFPEALEMAYKQLKAAESVQDPQRIANAYNNLSALHFETGDPERSKEMHERNLELAREIGYTRIECLAYINLADYYLFVGEYDVAVENGLRGLQLSREYAYGMFEIYALHMIGRAYQKQQCYDQALARLEEATNRSHALGTKVTESLSLLHMGDVLREMRQIERAKECLNRAVAISREIEGSREEYMSLLILSEIFEQEGDSIQALAHFKQYQSVKERFAGDKADLRLKVLKVTHDTETARKEAEIERLRAMELQRKNAEAAAMRRQLQRQLDYVQALSGCSQTLLENAKTEADQKQILNQALEHLRVGSRASRSYIYYSFQDPDLGDCLGIVAEACAPGIHPHDNPTNEIASWSRVPTSMFEALKSGKPIGGSIETLYAEIPDELEAYRNQINPLLSIMLFPIFHNYQLWGFVGFDDCVNDRKWDEREISVLGTASEMIANTLQRWHAQSELRSLNNDLELQVEARTAELSDTVSLLSTEIDERKRVENALQEMMNSLESHVVARTEELSTFFDLILMAGQGVDLTEIFEYVVPRVMEFTKSQSVVVDLVEIGSDAMNMIAAGGLPEEAPARIYISQFPPELKHWMQSPNEPLLVADLAKEIPSFTQAFNLHDFPYQTLLSVQIRVGDRIDGILSCFRTEKGGYGVDEVALATAVAQQLGMILETDHLRQQAQDLAVLEERERLARDLHDSVTQSLYSLSLFSRAGREAVEDGDNERLMRVFTELERNTLLILRELRLMLYDLRPPELGERSLAQAIEYRLNAVERRAGLQFDVAIDDPVGLSPADEGDLFYVVLEGLNNVVKHAQARHASLKLTQDDGHIHLLIADDGQGFNPQQSGGGLGLRNMRERVSRLGGQLTICSDPGSGTQLEAIIPHQPIEEP